MAKRLEDFRQEPYKCIRCGLCQIVCPVYAAMGIEPSVARGKVRLVLELLEGNIATSPRLAEIMSLCLDCGACLNNCPALVETGKLVKATRARIVQERGLPLPLKMALRIFLPSNVWQETITKLAYLYQHLGIQKLLRNSGALRLLPGGAANKDALMPQFVPVTFRHLLPQIPRSSGGKIKVAYFISCLTNMVQPQVGRSVITVLQEHGCEVVVPTDVVCCGTPQLAYGDTATAERLASHNAAVLAATGAAYIVTDCATCGSTLKQYGDFLPQGSAVAGKVRDVAEFLLELGAVKPGPRRQEVVVTYHDACHLNRGQKISAQPREILEAIPGVVFKEMAEADLCCGGAGSFGLTHYVVSMQILDRKIRNVAAVSPDILAVGCPSCRMQLEHGLAKQNLSEKIKVRHPLEILADTY